MRLFTAIELSTDARDAVREAQAALQASGLQARWAPLATTHLTVHFLGEQPEDRLPALRAGLAAACRGQSPLRLALTGLGAFPSLRRPRVLWLGVEGPLAPLEAACRQALLEGGVTLDGRPYHPHVTLARDPRGVVALPAPPYVEFDVDELVLYHSILGRSGAVHQVLERFSLGS